ncbi:hypothetical protein D3C81_1537090 [compost metagenome]
MLDLLRATNQCSIADRALLDTVDRLFAFLDQAFHRGAFDALEPDPQQFHDLVDALDLALGLFQVRRERGGQVRTGGGARQSGQRLGQLLLCTVDIRELVDEQVFCGLDRHGGAAGGFECPTLGAWVLVRCALL